MSQSPSTYLSRLSLKGTPSPIQPGSHMQPLERSSPTHGSGHYSEEDESDWEDDEDAGDVVSSPAGLRYNIAHLSSKTQRVTRGLFNTQEPPRISLELCGIKEESVEGGSGSGFFYAFQMHEVVPCSVRIGARDSTRFSMPRCECPDARFRHQRPCKHLVWLFDKIAKQALYSHDPDSELTMMELGYAEELGDPFRQISELRLDVLADSLHCDTTAPNSDTAPPNRARVKEAREMVAAVAGIEPREIDSFRPDLETSFKSDALIRRGDLEATLFSLILASNTLAACVRAELSPSDLAADPFRALRQRASRIISELDAYSSSLQNPALAAARRAQGKEAEGPRNVGWAAAQIRQCVAQIERLVSRGSRPLAGSARSSAARALVGILKSVASHNFDSHNGDTVDDRNLYMSLVGNQDTGFVYSALDTLVDQSQFVEELETVMELVGRFGAPESYASNMRGLITRMRSHTGDENKRSSVTFAADASVPRSATPPMEGVPPAIPPHQEPGLDPAQGEPSSSGSGTFLTPEVPASASKARARGGRGGGRGTGAGRTTGSGGAGSKRSVSGGGPDRGGRGSKRSR